MVYRIDFDPDALEDVKKLDRPVHQRLVGFLKTRVGRLDNPRDIGEALSGATLGHYWRYRVGDWRIICDIQDARIVVRMLRLGNHREVYRWQLSALGANADPRELVRPGAGAPHGHCTRTP